MKNKTQLSHDIDQFIRERMDTDASVLVDLIFEKFGEQYTKEGIRTRKHRIKKNSVEQKEENPKTDILPPKPEDQINLDRKVLKLQKQSNESENKYKKLLEIIDQLEMEKEALLMLRDGVDPYVFEYKVSENMTEATAVVLASDWHLEEYVDPATVNGLNKYTLDIAKKRVEQFFQNTLKLLEKEQKATKIDTLVLALLGDIISGNIHEELLENCQLRSIDAIVLAENLLIGGIDYLLKNSDVKLVIPCHVGNHTRITKKVHISTENGNSLETFMYHHLANHYKANDRVTFLIAGGYLSYLDIYGFTICFQHGHAIKYGGGVGGLTIPANKAIAQWEKLRRADLYCFGHFHQFFDGGNFICNGSLIGYNAFAIFIKGGFEKPKQAFFLIDKKRRAKTVVCPVLFDI